MKTARDNAIDDLHDSKSWPLHCKRCSASQIFQHLVHVPQNSEHMRHAYCCHIPHHLAVVSGCWLLWPPSLSSLVMQCSCAKLHVLATACRILRSNLTQSESMCIKASYLAWRGGLLTPWLAITCLITLTVMPLRQARGRVEGCTMAPSGAYSRLINLSRLLRSVAAWLPIKSCACPHA